MYYSGYWFSGICLFGLGGILEDSGGRLSRIILEGSLMCRIPFVVFIVGIG